MAFKCGECVQETNGSGTGRVSHVIEVMQRQVDYGSTPDANGGPRGVELTTWYRVQYNNGLTAEVTEKWLRLYDPLGDST